MYYLAYGSNLNVSQMMHRCPDAVPVGDAVIKDYELIFKGSKSGAYLTIEPKKGSSVPVGVWEISDRDERNLDLYEGFPSFYYKAYKKVTIKKEQGKAITAEALVYIMHEERLPALPSITYMRTCLQGYYDFGYDYMTLIEAVNATKEMMNRKEAV